MGAEVIDNALVARLSGDAQLQALMPGGVWFDLAGKGQTAFVIIGLNEDAAFQQFEGEAAARTVYLVKAVELQTSGKNAANAAARIHTLLQWNTGPAPLTMAGYDLLALRRVERIRYTEVDATNPDARWQHQGGLYEVITAEVAASALSRKDERNGSQAWQ